MNNAGWCCDDLIRIVILYTLNSNNCTCDIIG